MGEEDDGPGPLVLAEEGGLEMSMCKGCLGLWMRLRLTEVGRDVGGTEQLSRND